MRKYVKPLMESEAFVSNEYVSACSLIECFGKCGQSEVVNGVKPEDLTSNMINMDGSGYYMYTGTVNGVSATDCETYSSSSKPTWIENIYNTGDRYGLYVLEEIVYAFYKLFGGQDNQNITNYHAVQVSLKGESNGPNAS